MQLLEDAVQTVDEYTIEPDYLKQITQAVQIRLGNTANNNISILQMLKAGFLITQSIFLQVIIRHLSSQILKLVWTGLL